MISEQPNLQESRRRMMKLWIWNAIGLTGFLLAAGMSVGIVNKAATRAVEENRKADIAIAATEKAETRLATLNAELDLVEKKLKTSDSRLLSITTTALSQGSITSDQVSAALDPTKTISISTHPVCFVKYHDDPQSAKLAESAVLALRKNSWVAETSKATYRGPRKRPGLQAQIRYSDPADKDTAMKAVELLKKEGIPTFMDQVPEPGGQTGIFRLWILH